MATNKVELARARAARRVDRAVTTAERLEKKLAEAQEAVLRAQEVVVRLEGGLAEVGVRLARANAQWEAIREVEDG